MGFGFSKAGRRRGFTLIELMVVIGIAGILMMTTIPTIYRRLHPNSMEKAVNDVMEACSNARAHAILNNTDTELVIRPFDRQLDVAVAAPRQRAEPGRLESHDVSGRDWRMPERGEEGSGGGGGIFSAKLSDRISIEGLGINGEDWTEDETARVRFYPNGTCDEMSIVLVSDKQERRNIWLEVVTGLAEFEVDPQKFKVR